VEETADVVMGPYGRWHIIALLINVKNEKQRGLLVLDKKVSIPIAPYMEMLHFFIKRVLPHV
jgi:hypothetical protein